MGMYPTAVRFNPADKRLYVANGRGATPQANPQGPNPVLPKSQTVREYIGGLYRGTLEHPGFARRRADDQTQQTGISVQPASRRPWYRRRRFPKTVPFRRSGSAQPDQILHLHHQREPHLRPSVRRHEGGQRRPRPVHLPREDHAERPPLARQFVLSTTSTATARYPPRGTSGRWAPTAPTSSRRRGRSATAAARSRR